MSEATGEKQDRMVTFLQKVPLFSNLPDEDLIRICAMAQRVTLEPGEELFAEGSQGSRAFVIESGDLEIVKVSGRPFFPLCKKAFFGKILTVEPSPVFPSEKQSLDIQLRDAPPVCNTLFFNCFFRSPQMLKSLCVTSAARGPIIADELGT